MLARHSLASDSELGIHCTVCGCCGTLHQVCSTGKRNKTLYMKCSLLLRCLRICNSFWQYGREKVKQRYWIQCHSYCLTWASGQQSQYFRWDRIQERLGLLLSALDLLVAVSEETRLENERKAVFVLLSVMLSCRNRENATVLHLCVMSNEDQATCFL